MVFYVKLVFWKGLRQMNKENFLLRISVPSLKFCTAIRKGENGSKNTDENFATNSNMAASDSGLPYQKNKKKNPQVF